MNSIINDIERIQKFETKIKVMTGAQSTDSLKSKKTSPDQSSINIRELRQDFSTKPGVLDEWKRKVLKTIYTIDRYTSPRRIIFTIRPEQVAFNRTVGKIASLDFKISKSSKIIKSLEESLHEIDVLLLNRKAFLNSTPSIKPTDGWVTSHFRPRKSHYAKRVKMHEGIDIGARSGTPIVSTADGVVVFSGKKPGFGNFIKIRHGFGIETIYAHAKKLFVRAGRKVKRGDLIAAVGSTGYSTGLMFTMK